MAFTPCFTVFQVATVQLGDYRLNLEGHRRRLSATCGNFMHERRKKTDKKPTGAR